MRLQVLAVLALIAATLIASFSPGLRGLSKFRAQGMGALHALHFDTDVRPNRETRRSMHKRLLGFFMLRDGSGSVTDAALDEPKLVTKNGVKGFFVGEKFCPVFAGADDAALTLDSLSGVSVETLKARYNEAIDQVEKLATENLAEFKRERHQEIKLRTEDIKTLKEAIAEREGDSAALAEIQRMREADEGRKNALRSQARQEIYPTDGGLEVVEFQTPGEMFTGSDQYDEFKKRGYKGESDVVSYPEASKLMGLRTGTDKLKMRAPITGASGSAGGLQRPDFLGLQEPGLVRPLTVRDMVTVLPTESDAIEYVKENTRASNAAPVSEAAQIAHTGDTGATKPEGGLTFSVVTDTVKIIAEWVAVTTKILQDAPQLRAYIDEYLLYDLALELEDQMLTGDGTGENFTGILNTAGINTVAAYTAPAGPLDNIRKGITLVQKNGKTNPTAVVVSPEDSQTIDLLKENNEANNFVGSGPFAYQANSPIWGLPRIVSEGMTTGTALVGDFRRAVLYDRMQAQISVGTVGDDFIRNLRRILAEGRYGFGVRRPKAFTAVTLTVAP